MSQDAIKVVCRLRPLNKIEIANNGVECVSYTDTDITLNVKMPNEFRLEVNKINTLSLSIKFLGHRHNKYLYIKKLQFQLSSVISY